MLNKGNSSSTIQLDSSAPSNSRLPTASASRLPAAHVEAAGHDEQELAREFKEFAANCKQRFADPAFDLPVLPSSAMRVLNLIQDPDASSKKVAQALQVDPILTAKFLRLANSPMYAGTRKIESVHFAIDRLGMATIKNVVLTIALNSTIVREKRLGVSAMALWDHAVNAAIAAQGLAALIHISPTSTFTAGLMHDIGKLPAWIMINQLHLKHPKARPQFLEQLVEDEHIAIGSALTEVWDMPQEVKVAVSAHHGATSVDEATMLVIRRLPDVSISDANTLALVLSCITLADGALATAGLSTENLSVDFTQGLASELGLNEQQGVDYLAALPKMIQDSNMKSF